MGDTEQDKYLGLLKQLFPIGKAWDLSENSNLTKLLGAFAQELGRVDQRVSDLIRETDPQRTEELLLDWEHFLGIPDDCSEEEIESLSLEQRRQQIVQKLTFVGGQNISYYIDMAKAFGLEEVEIKEYRPFRAGINRAGDTLTNGGWVFTFEMRSPQIPETSTLECTVLKLKPAHTHAIFHWGVGG
ncbi:MAG: DUF2313 domain-containing protein [Deltaproteobacteria bacterium]|nr:DUF2313 domain-containing protein [Deltaproteobacteria bacterium]